MLMPPLGQLGWQRADEPVVLQRLEYPPIAWATGVEPAHLLYEVCVVAGQSRTLLVHDRGPDIGVVDPVVIHPLPGWAFPGEQSGLDEAADGS